MKQCFLKKEGNRRLLLFFAGWGADERLFDRQVAEGYDYLLCFDYRKPDFDYGLLASYESIRLLAWSMGVWVAGKTFEGNDTYRWEMKVAVNGTPFPVDGEKGIPPAVFDGTLTRFSENTLARFRRRMCGSVEQVKAFLSHNPYRSVEELREELAVLGEVARTSPADAFSWDKAIVGTHDNIFPVENQRRAWKGTAVCEIDAAHYDERLFDALLLDSEKNLWIRD